MPSDAAHDPEADFWHSRPDHPVRLNPLFQWALDLGAVWSWFLAAFSLISIWMSVNVHSMHRFLQIQVMYRFPALHPRNNDVGRWTGLPMHPVQHFSISELPRCISSCQPVRCI